MPRAFRRSRRKDPKSWGEARICIPLQYLITDRDRSFLNVRKPGRPGSIGKAALLFALPRPRHNGYTVDYANKNKTSPPRSLRPASISHAQGMGGLSMDIPRGKEQLRRIYKRFGLDEFGFSVIPVKFGNVRISRLMNGRDRGCEARRCPSLSWKPPPIGLPSGMRNIESVESRGLIWPTLSRGRISSSRGLPASSRCRGTIPLSTCSPSTPSSKGICASSSIATTTSGRTSSRTTSIASESIRTPRAARCAKASICSRRSATSTKRRIEFATISGSSRPYEANAATENLFGFLCLAGYGDSGNLAKLREAHDAWSESRSAPISSPCCWPCAITSGACSTTLPRGASRMPRSICSARSSPNSCATGWRRSRGGKDSARRGCR